MTFHTKKQKQSSIEVTQPLVNGMTELFEWLKSDDGIDHLTDKYETNTNVIAKDAPFSIALVELLVLANNEGIDVKQLIQRSVIKFHFERHLQDAENENLKFIFADYLS